MRILQIFGWERFFIFEWQKEHPKQIIDNIYKCKGQTNDNSWFGSCPWPELANRIQPESTWRNHRNDGSTQKDLWKLKLVFNYASYLVTIALWLPKPKQFVTLIHPQLKRSIYLYSYLWRMLLWGQVQTLLRSMFLPLHLNQHQNRILRFLKCK